MSSFLDDINQMLLDAEIQEISEHLFQEWMNSNLDEGTFWADYQFALMCNSTYIKQKFNEFYELKEGDNEYLN